MLYEIIFQWRKHIEKTYEHQHLMDLFKWHNTWDTEVTRATMLEF